jgi:hypothetical protein
MAKNRKLQQTQQEIDEEELKLLAENELPPDIQKLTEELGSGNFSVVVQKYTPEGTLEKIGTFIPDEFNADMLAEKYGGGRFKFTIRDDKGHYLKQTAVNYAKPLEPPAPKDGAAPQNASQEKLVEILQKQLDSTKDEQKQTTVAMIQMMTKIMELQMTTANKPVSQPASTLDEVIKVVNVLGLKENKNPLENITAVMGLLKDGMEMGKNMSLAAGDQKPEDVILMKLAEQVMPMLSKLAQAKAVQPVTGLPQIPQRQAAPQGSEDGVIIEKIPPAIPKKELIKMDYKSETEKSVVETLRENSASLLGCAKNSMDINLVSNLIISKLDEHSVDELYDYFSGDNAQGNLERIMEFLPEFKKYSGWFVELLNELLTSIEKELNNGTGTDANNPDGKPDGNDAAKADSAL